MSKRTYDWLRFWAPLGEPLTLDFDGFLPDPNARIGRTLNSKAQAWSQLAARPCLVLLGEPGMGKSTEVTRASRASEASGRAKHIDLAHYSSEERLLRDAFESTDVANWLANGHAFELFFDALDESLLVVRTFAKNLVARLSELPRDRVRLRVACRTADWPMALDRELRELYAKDAFGIYELLPLRRCDCIEAARANGFAHPEQLVREFVSRELQPFAMKPLTLEMLLRTSKGGALPGSRRDLFEQATLLLATEPNDLYPIGTQTLNATERVAIAQRIAAATLLCGKPIILRTEDVPGSTELALAQLAGETERVNETSVDVNQRALVETVRTGLFTGAGTARLARFHHSIAEFLAARWLGMSSLDPAQVDELLFHPEDSHRVVPQLRGVAGWLAMLEPRVLNRLGEYEPELLLGADAPALSEETRAKVVDVLLRKVDALTAHDFQFGLRAHYGNLKHPDLAGQLRPYVLDKARNPMVRRLAIDLAEACQVGGLEDLLVDVALDRADHYATRQQAVSAIGTIGSMAARRRLRMLVTDPAPEDSDDELRGYALTALWPEHITRRELFAALREPRTPTYYGTYASFVSSLASRLRDEDLPDGLDWAVTHTLTSAWLPSEKVVEELVSRATSLLADAATAKAYVRLMAASLKHKPSGTPPGWAVILSEDQDPTRRALLADLLRQLGDGSYFTLVTRLFARGDLAWLVSQLDSVSEALLRERIVGMTKTALSFGLEFDDLNCVLSATLRHDDLHRALAPFTNAIDVSSEVAATMRRQHAEFAKMAERHERPLLNPSPRERVRALIDDFEGGNVDAFWCLGRELTLMADSAYYDAGMKTQFTRLPGWLDADEQIRARILVAAKRYLRERDAKPGAWVGKSIFYYPAIAGYQAFRLLVDVEPDALASIEPGTWAAWAPIIVGVRGFANDSDSVQVDLLRRAYARAPNDVLSALLRVVADDDRQHKQVFAEQLIDAIWDVQVATAMRRLLTRTRTLHPQSMAQILGPASSSQGCGSLGPRSEADC